MKFPMNGMASGNSGEGVPPEILQQQMLAQILRKQAGAGGLQGMYGRDHGAYQQPQQPQQQPPSQMPF